MLFRDRPGTKEMMLVRTDTTLGATEVIEGDYERWSLEETFGWVKSRLAQG